MKAARVLGFSIALATLVMMLVLSSGSGRDVVDVIVVRSIGLLSWLVGGLAALSAARDLDADDTRDGIFALVAQRGYSRRMLVWARAAATVQVVARLVGTPALVLALVAVLMSRSGMQTLARILLCVGIVGYVALLGVVLGLLARWSAAYAPRHGRALLAAVVLGPELVKYVSERVPSVPALFGWLLEQLVRVGSAL